MSNNAECSKCNDTGAIKSGDNDLPCDCPAGDKAMFHVAGVGIITGAVVKKLNISRLNSSPEPKPIQPS